MARLAPVPPAPQPAPGVEYKGPFGFGRHATPEEIKAWDINVMTDGKNLPPGQGTVPEGGRIYAAKCAVCHGDKGQAMRHDWGPVAPLVEPYDPKKWPPANETIGNYWAYSTTLYDYIYRAMPFPQPGSLTPNEVYNLVAWLLWMNKIIPEDAVMNAQTLPKVKMPAKERYVPYDPRDFNPFQ